MFQVIVEGDYNYSDPQIQDRMAILVETIKNSSYIDEESDVLTTFWMEKWIFDMDLFAIVGLDGTLSMENLKNVSTSPIHFLRIFYYYLVILSSTSKTPTHR